MKAFSFLAILKNFGKQLSSLASQMPWCNLRFNLGSMSVLSRVSRPFSRTSLSASSGTSFGTSRRASHFAAMIFAVLTLSVANIGMAWGDTTYYLQGISGSSGTSTLTNDFYTTASYNQTVSVTYDGISYTKAVKFGGNITAITSNNYPDRMIRYDCKTTRTDFVIVAYANSSSKNLCYGNIMEGAKGSDNTINAYKTKTLNNGSLTTQEYSIISSTPASLFVSVDASSNAFVVQIIAIEKGDPLPTPGSVGYKVNFKKTRVVARSGSATSLDNNLEIHSNENITAGTTAKIKMQTKGTNYIKFTTTAACTAKITINGIGAGFYVADDKNATVNASELQNDGNKTYELEVGSGTHYIVPNGSNMYVEHIELAAPSCAAADLTAANITSNGNQEAGTGITFSTVGTPADGDTWYWQTSATGTDDTHNATSPYTTATTAGSYTVYLRAYNSASDCWGTAASMTNTITSNTIISCPFYVYNGENVDKGNKTASGWTINSSTTMTKTNGSSNGYSYWYQATASNSYVQFDGSIALESGDQIKIQWTHTNGSNKTLALTINGSSASLTSGNQANSSNLVEAVYGVTSATNVTSIKLNSSGSSGCIIYQVSIVKAACTTPSETYDIHIGKNNDNYTDESLTNTSGTTWSKTITLDAGSYYEFKVKKTPSAGDAVWYGNNGRITATTSPAWDFNTSDGNCKLYTTVAGSYTFSWDASNNKLTVTYPAGSHPTKRIYMACGDTWCDASPKFFVHSWLDSNTADTELTVDACDGDVYTADIPWFHDYVIFTRQAPASTGIVWEGSNFWNRSNGDFYLNNYNKLTFTDWTDGKGNFSGGTYSPATYSITFIGNGNTGGSMSNLTGIACGANQAITANAYTRTGYSFAGWKANVNVTIGGSTVTAGTVIANSATIQNISQDITLTAQWTAKEYDINYKDQGNADFSGTHGANHPTKHTYGTATALVEPTKANYEFEGWYTTSECTGSAVTSLGATAYTANITLYAKWTQVIVSVESVEVSPSSKTIEIDATQELTAKISPDNATNKNVTWSSSNESVATVDENGLVTAVAAGTATITATTKDGNKTDQCEITVEKIQPEKYDFSIDKTELCGDEKATLTLDDSQLGVTYELREDSDTPIADTEKQGTGSALTWNVGAGTYVVYAKETDKYSERQMDGSKITISNGTATSITTQPTNQEVTVGEKATLTVVAAGTSLSYQWKESATEDGEYSNVSTGSGKTSDSYSVTPAAAGTKWYKCVVTGTCGEVTTEARKIVANAAAAFTVTYDAQGGTCKASDTGSSITLPTPTKDDHTFQGWYTSGGELVSSPYSPTADITLHALWREDECSGGGGGSTTLFNVDFTDETTETISTSNSGATFVAKTYDGYNMSFGVKSSKDIDITNGTGLDFKSNNCETYQCLAIPLNLTKDNEVTAVITLKSKGTVKYKWVTGSLPPTPSFSSPSTYSLSNATNTLTYTPATAGEYVLYLGRSGSGDGSQYIESIVITQAGGGSGTCYYVTYNGNGADGGFTTDEASHASGSNVTVKTNGNGFTKTGYRFTGWNTAADGTGTSYAAGGTITGISGNMTLYAQWEEDKAEPTEPTVTWFDVPATVYPGQQFVFTVETNTDATLNVSNLTATNATLVNISEEGGVFTATAQIAADAAAAPTFTLSTADGATYSAKVDTKSGITLGSCESSSGTATLFAFTCTSTTTAINTYSATGGTATLSGSAMSDKITIDKIDYYKFNSSSLWTMALSNDSTFAVGDVITFTMACNTGSDKTGRGVILNDGTTKKITLTRDYAKNTAQESSYEVVADDGIAGQSSFTIKRADSDIKFGSVTVTRAGQSLDNKQETTIEWPETVDGVRVVEYEEGLKVPSLAIISSIGEATYSSNNEDVGSFRNGNVELTGTGNVTITVSVAAAGCMEAAESSYVLTVTNKRYTVEKGTITGAGCDMSISETSVSSGDVVTLTPVPATGYSLTSWDVYKKGDSNTKVTVTNNRFTMPEYNVVVNATFSTKSSVATLDALSVTNADTEDPVELSPTFASGTTEYTATLSCGTTSAPRISATKTDSKATTRLTNVSDLKGDAAACTATIVVTAEDGVTTQTYTIVFTVSAVGCVRLAPSITSISEDEDICSGGSADLSVTAESRNNDGGTLSYQWQKYNGDSWDNITGATEADYTTEAITVNSKFRCVVSDTKDEDVKSTTSDEITIGVTSIATPTYTQGANVVTLSCATEGATIWYSTDGNDPAADADNSRQGTSVSITRSGVTVKAIAYLEGCHSAVMTLTNADYSSGAVDGSIIWSMNNAGNNEAPKFNVTCVPNTILSAATAFTLQNDADYGMSKKDDMSVKISGITSYSADGKHVSLDVTVADGYTFTPCSLSVTYQPVSNAAKYKAVIGDNTSSESSSVSGGTTGTQVVNFTSGKPISAGTTPLHLYVYGSSLATWRLAGDIILYGRVQTTGTTYYSVTYNRNGATSGTVPQDDNLYTSGQTVELAANTGGLAKDGYIFSGWSTSADGTALTENPTITGDMTLYAVWTKDESAQTEACANVTTSGTQSSIAVGDYSLYFSSSNTGYSESSISSSAKNKCDGDYRYYMPGVVVALTNSNATTIKLKGQQDYDLTVSRVMVADALDGAWSEISFTPVAYKSKDCGEVGISGVQIAQGKYVFLGFSGGPKNEFRISGLCITPFTDPCPSISIAKNPVSDTWAKDATVQISVGATTDAGVLSYQWQVSSDNTNFSDIDAATGTAYDVPTGTVGTKYYRCVVSNGSCSKNSESAKIVIVEPTVTALYDYWYIKQGRQTPNIALFEVTKGTPASNVTIPAAEIGKYGFVYNTSDYKIYLQGSAPSAIYSDEDVEVTASIKSNSNADNITLHLLRATPHPQLAFVVTGTKGAGFENYDTIQTTCDLYTQLALDYIIQPTNVYHTTDEKAIRAYYSQFDIILNTDFPDTQKGPNSDKGQWNVGYVNALGAMVDIVPILTMEAFVSRLPNWKIKHDPKSPSTKQYSMLLNCRAHEIFGGIPDSHMGEEMINGEEHKVVTIVDENNYTEGDALQGFSADELSDMDIVGQIHDGSGQLMACVERQFETTARMMVLGINSAAMVKLTEDGIKVVKNALIYLQHKNAKDVSDCSLRFDNKAGDHQWSTEGNWAPGYSTLPTSENKVIILADCELNTLAHVDMAKINEDVKLTIKPTGALIVDGTITRFGGEDWLAQEGEITPDNLAIEADENNIGALILSNPEGKIGAEVQMYSKSYWETVGGKKKKYWSYVGVPIANVDIPNYFNQGFTYLYTETAGWEKKWDGSVLQPFEGIGLSMQKGHKETFYGNLASTLSRKIALTHGSTGENLIGNSWTAPIQIANFDEADFGGATAAVYVYNTGRDEQASGEIGKPSYGESNSTQPGQWISVPVNTAKENAYTGLKVIPAMNAFQVNTTAAATLTLDYDKLVRKNAASNGDINDPMRAPRRAALKRIDALMRIRVSGEKTHTDIWLQQDERFSEGFDNGWEAVYAECDNRSAQLYAVSMLGQMSFIAKPYLEGTPIGFAPSRDGNIYTFSFQYDGEEVYYLNDLKEQKSTLIEAGETYTFTYEEGEMSPRFLISVTPFESPAITTGIENPEKQTSNAQKIIYNDKLYIIRGGRLYDATGKVVR